MTGNAVRGRAPYVTRRPIAAFSIAAVAVLTVFAAFTGRGAWAQESARESATEDIFILRSIREHHAPATGWCNPSKTGFEPFAKDADSLFSFWSVRSRAEDGKLLDMKQVRVADLRACFGATSEPARQNFYAEIQLGALSFRGKGECLAMAIDFPQAGLFPVRCQLVLDGLPPPYTGGLLTTNTLTSKAAFGGDTDPPGYTQASIATIRLWKAN